MQSGTSLGEQWRRGEALARSFGAQRVERYEDAGVSGASPRRPALDALLADLREGRIDLVVATDPDRISRRLVDQLLLTEEISRHAELRFVQFDWQDTPDGRLFYALRGAIAEFERERIRQRTHLGRIATARQGRIATPPHQAYGYVYSRREHSLRVDPAEAGIVHEVYLRYAMGLEGPERIAKDLAARGVPTRLGKRWHAETVRRMLRNPIYSGRLRQLGGVTVAVPAILTPELWRAAQDRAERLRRVPPGHPAPSRPRPLLTGLAFCGLCGAALTVHAAGRRRGNRRSYVCRAHRRALPPKGAPGDVPEARCPLGRYDALTLEQAVLATLHRVLASRPAASDASSGQTSATCEAADFQAGGPLRLVEARAGILRLFRRGVLTEEETEAELLRLGALAGIRPEKGPSHTACEKGGRSSARGWPDGEQGTDHPDIREHPGLTPRQLIEAHRVRVTVGPGYALHLDVQAP